MSDSEANKTPKIRTRNGPLGQVLRLFIPAQATREIDEVKNRRIKTKPGIFVIRNRHKKSFNANRRMVGDDDSAKTLIWLSHNS
jgi:hypothetical protein